jgi:hypothetical protein
MLTLSSNDLHVLAEIETRREIADGFDEQQIDGRESPACERPRDRRRVEMTRPAPRYLLQRSACARQRPPRARRSTTSDHPDRRSPTLRRRVQRRSHAHRRAHGAWHRGYRLSGARWLPHAPLPSRAVVAEQAGGRIDAPKTGAKLVVNSLLPTTCRGVHPILRSVLSRKTGFLSRSTHPAHGRPEAVGLAETVWIEGIVVISHAANWFQFGVRYLWQVSADAPAAPCRDA